MQNRLIQLTLAGLTLTAVASAAFTARADLTNGLPLNVRDFGAKGDGNTDDTAAIQKCFDAGRPGPCPDVIFPVGTYKISDTLKLYANNIRGQHATIQQTKPEKGILYYDNAHRVTVEGMTFEGGARQIDMGNGNVVDGLVLVNDCRFLNSTGMAVYFGRGSQCTHFIVKNCVFAYCFQALSSTADWTTFADSWITTGIHMTNCAAIVNVGVKLLCENIVGVPLVNGADQRWIDNYCDVTCHNFRFGGEDGGFTGIVNFGKGRTVTVTDSCLWADGNPKRRTLVYCEEMPDTLLINGNFLGAPPVMANPKLDLKKAFAHKPDGLLNWDIAHNSGAFQNEPETARILKAAAARDKSLPPYEGGQLNAKETKAALARAVTEVKALPPEPLAAPATNWLQQTHYKVTPHIQRTNATDYVEFRYDPKTWDLSQRMDNQLYRNHELVACAQAGDDIAILRRVGGWWPHISIRVVMDLDQTPVLSWKLRDPGKFAQSGTVMKIVLDDTGELRVLSKNEYPQFFYLYNAVNLREAFHLKGGKHSFTAIFYVCGNNYGASKAEDFTLPKGGYMILDFLRAEKNKALSKVE